MNHDPQEKLNVTTEQKGGSRALSIYTVRKIKVFAVTEPELNAISAFNTISLTLFSLGSFFFTFFLENIIYPKSEDHNWILDPFGWTALVFFLIGSILLLKKASTLKQIKNESEEIEK